MTRPRKHEIVTGERFGFLVALAPSFRERDWMTRCRCDCGTEKVIRESYLVAAHTKSCGCKRGELSAAHTRTHGMKKTSEFTTWCGMRQRCYDTNHHKYPNYGGRGIQVCEQWRGSFQSFYADMGPKPTPKHSLDRIDNNGNYEPSNCRWATNKEQCRNTRFNRFVEFGGERLTVAEWAERAGINQATLGSRLTQGWTMGRALTEPVLVRIDAAARASE